MAGGPSTEANNDAALSDHVPEPKHIFRPGLKAVLASSQANNANDEITGFLIAAGQWFLQILEGDKDRVSATLDRIRRDDRHTDIVVVQSREIAARSFPEWSMGGTLRTPETLAIFARNGLDADFDPSLAVAPVVFGLAMDLQDHERLQRFGIRTR